MKRGFALFMLGMGVMACASSAPTPSVPPATGTPTSAPTPTTNVDLPTLTLPNNISGIPGSDDFTATLEPHTPADSVPVGEEQVLELGHCGLGSPIDVDGSLWDPVAGDDGNGGPLTEDQIGDLINATPVVFVLVDHETMLMATQHGARILLTRHDGPRAYFLCA